METLGNLDMLNHHQTGPKIGTHHPHAQPQGPLSFNLWIPVEEPDGQHVPAKRLAEQRQLPLFRTRSTTVPPKMCSGWFLLDHALQVESLSSRCLASGLHQSIIGGTVVGTLANACLRSLTFVWKWILHHSSGKRPQRWKGWKKSHGVHSRWSPGRSCTGSL